MKLDESRLLGAKPRLSCEVSWRPLAVVSSSSSIRVHFTSCPSSETAARLSAYQPSLFIFFNPRLKLDLYQTVRLAPSNKMPMQRCLLLTRSYSIRNYPAITIACMVDFVPCDKPTPGRSDGLCPHHAAFDVGLGGQHGAGRAHGG